MSKQNTKKETNQTFQSKAWHRQRDESQKAYEAFEIYLNLGIVRSLQAVCKQLAKSYVLVSRWKNKYNWDERCLAFENWERQQRDAAAAEAIHKIEIENRKRRNRVREYGFELGESLIELGKSQLAKQTELLKFPVQEIKQDGETVTKEDGTQTKLQITIKPLPPRVFDATKAIREGISLMRLSLDMPTENAAFAPVAADLASYEADLSQMSDDELTKELQRLEDEEKRLVEQAKKAKTENEA